MRSDETLYWRTAPPPYCQALCGFPAIFLHRALIYALIAREAAYISPFFDVKRSRYIDRELPTILNPT